MPPTNLSRALAAEQRGVTHLTRSSCFLLPFQDFDFPYPFYLSYCKWLYFLKEHTDR